MRLETEQIFESSPRQSESMVEVVTIMVDLKWIGYHRGAFENYSNLPMDKSFDLAPNPVQEQEFNLTTW